MPGRRLSSVRVPVTRAGRAALRGKRSLSVTLTVAVTDAAGNAATTAGKAKVTRAAVKKKKRARR